MIVSNYSGIYSKVGISEQRVSIAIEPLDVRLVTGKDDQYCWRAVLHIRHLFSKQFSDYGLGAFKDLCQGVGETFKAIPRSDRRSVALSTNEPARMS